MKDKDAKGDAKEPQGLVDPNRNHRINSRGHARAGAFSNYTTRAQYMHFILVPRGL